MHQLVVFGIIAESLTAVQQLRQIGRRINYRNLPQDNESFYESIADPTNKEFIASELRELSYHAAVEYRTNLWQYVSRPDKYDEYLTKISTRVKWTPDIESLAVMLIFKSTGLKVVLVGDMMEPVRHDSETIITDQHITIARDLQDGYCHYHPTVKVDPHGEFV